jgi:hypothetical protein
MPHAMHMTLFERNFISSKIWSKSDTRNIGRLKVMSNLTDFFVSLEDYFLTKDDEQRHRP